MGKNFKKKTKTDKFDDIGKEIRDAIMQSTTDEIRKRIADVAILDCAEKALLKKDPAILAKKAELKDLMDPVRDNLKGYKLQIEFCSKILREKGVGRTLSKEETDAIRADLKKAGVSPGSAQRIADDIANI